MYELKKIQWLRTNFKSLMLGVYSCVIRKCPESVLFTLNIHVTKTDWQMYGNNASCSCTRLLKHLVCFIIECEQGLYGIGCSETCGHCRDVDQCFHVNGTCLTGCDAGYQDGLCKTRECCSVFSGLEIK